MKAYIEISKTKSHKGGKGHIFAPSATVVKDRNRTGAFHIYAETLNGSASLTLSGDIFDLIGYVERIDKLRIN